MKARAPVIIATLAAASVLLASAALVGKPSAALTRSLESSATATSKPLATLASPIPSPTPSRAPTLRLMPVETPPTAPTLSPVLIPLPVPGQPLTLPILYMHQVVPIPPDIVNWSGAAQQAFLQSVPVCAFMAQMDWLAAHGYHTVLPRDVVAFWDQGRLCPRTRSS